MPDARASSSAWGNLVPDGWWDDWGEGLVWGLYYALMFAVLYALARVSWSLWTE